MRIALFATCISDVMFPQAAEATVHLLERLGHEVVFPEDQGCCGQMHTNTGYYPEAMPLIRNHVKTFAPVLDGEWDAIVVPSGSCTGSLRHQAELSLESSALGGLTSTCSGMGGTWPSRSARSLRQRAMAYTSVLYRPPMGANAPAVSP